MRRDDRPSSVPSAPGRPTRSQERTSSFLRQTGRGEEKRRSLALCSLADPRSPLFLFSSPPPSLAQGVRYDYAALTCSFSMSLQKRRSEPHNVTVPLGERGRGRGALARRALPGSRNGKKKEMWKTAAISLSPFFSMGKWPGNSRLEHCTSLPFFLDFEIFWDLE